MAARRRRRRPGRARRKENTSWSNNSATSPLSLLISAAGSAGNEIELIPSGMTDAVSSVDIRLLRIVGSLTFAPQSAATASAGVGFAFVRTLSDEAGIVTTITDPTSTDVDSGAQDILLQRQFTPDYGAQLTATALDLAMSVEIDIRVGRRLDRRNGIMLFVSATVDARISMTHRLRILTSIIR